MLSKAEHASDRTVGRFPKKLHTGAMNWLRRILPLLLVLSLALWGQLYRLFGWER
jgi:hypothetical protein